jgi:hypothetical protein
MPGRHETPRPRSHRHGRRAPDAGAAGGTPTERPRGYRGGHGDRDGRDPSFRWEEVRTTEAGREVTAHRVRHAGRDPRDEHPAPDVDERPAGGKKERRAGRRAIRMATGLGLTAFALCGLGVLVKGIATNDAPDKVPAGPALLDPTNHDVPGQANGGGNLTGDALKAKLHADVQRLVNNGEGDDGKGKNGTTVTVAPGILTVATPDGQHVSYVNPIVDLDGLPQQAAATVRAGHFDAASWNLLDGRVFATGAAKNTPLQGQTGPNYDRGVVDIDVTDTGAQFAPAQGGPHITDVAVSWESADPIAVGAQGPLEQNTKTGQFGQHDVGGNWQPMLVGAPVNTPPAPH